MFASISCPTCRHKFTIPEGAMGKRLNCPNCQTPFLAGKSVATADGPQTAQPQPAPQGEPAFNKTMLATQEPPIRYNCPRCRKPLESPAIEAGTKKPCPACGQRLQVPAAPPPSAQEPGLNKTILAVDEGTGPAPGNRAATPSYAASAAAPGAVATAGSTPHGHKGPPWWPKSTAGRGLAIGGILLGALILLSLLTGPSAADREKYLEAKRELDKLRADIEHNKALVEQQKKFEQELQKMRDQMMAEAKSRQERLDLERDLDRKNQAYLDDKKLAAEAKAKRDLEQREIDRAKQEAEKKQQEAMEMKNRLDALQRQIEAANQKATTIIQAPPPAYYPWHPRYYWGW